MNEWRNYESIRPAQDLPILLNRAEGVFYAKDLDPAMNVAGLQWKPTGIYRTEMDEVLPEVRAQREIHVGIFAQLGMSLEKEIFGYSAGEWNL